MATYPAFPQLRSSRFEPDSNIMTDVSDGGTIRQRHMWSSSVYSGNIYHALYTEAEVQQLQQFYDDNRLLTFTFVWASDPPSSNITYQCQFTEAPVYQWVAQSYWEAQVPIIGKRIGA